MFGIEKYGLGVGNNCRNFSGSIVGSLVKSGFVVGKSLFGGEKIILNIPPIPIPVYSTPYVS